MGFDWKSFATGFMESRAEDIKEKKAEARAYKLKQEEQAESNLPVVQKRKATVNKVLGLTKMLESNGASKAQIQAAIASGANGVATFAEKVQKAVEANGGRRLTSSDVDSIIRLPEGFQPIDESLESYVSKTFGGYQAPRGETVEEPDISFWDRLTGDAAMKKTKYKLGKETVGNGMTAAEINAIARQQEYEALIPSTFATFTDFKRFDSSARAGVEELLLEKTQFLEEMDPEYQAALATIASIDPGNQIPEQQEARAAALEVIANKKQQAFGSIFEDAISMYGTGALTGMEDLMTTYMGPDYVKNLQEGLAPAINEATDQEVAATIDLSGGKVEKTDAGITMSHPQVFADPETGEPVEVNFTVGDDGLVVSASAGGETFEGDDAQVLFNQFNSFTPQGTIARGGLETPALDVLPENVTSLDVTREEWKEMSRSERRKRGLPISTFGGMRETFGTEEGLAMVDLKRNANPDAFYKLKISGKPGAFKVKGSDLALIPDQALVRELGDFSIAEFGIDEDMPSKTFSASRLKRMFGEGAKMPVSVTGDETEEERTPSDMRPQARPEGLMSRDMSIRDKAIERFGLTREQIEEGMDTGQVTEADLQILVESGDELYEYVKENVDPSAGEMQYYELLSNWADENNKILPANLGFLVFQLKKVVSDE